jgi:hypothetical protein
MAYKTIAVKGDPVRLEIKATAATLYPGYLLERTSAGLVKAHSNAGQNAQKLFALEDDLQGKEINDAYSASARIQCGIFRSGDQVYAVLKDGENVSIGDFLESAGTGELQKHTASSAGAVEYPEAIVGVAVEALDLSTSAAESLANRRILVEII